MSRTSPSAVPAPIAADAQSKPLSTRSTTGARVGLDDDRLAAALGIDPPNATVLVDDLEAPGLVRRRHHPTDRRAKIVEATRKARALARRANEILGTLHPGLARPARTTSRSQ